MARAETNRVVLTKALIDALPLPPAGQRAHHFDAKVPELAIRISSTGARSWTIFTRPKGGRPQRITLGAYPAMPIEWARTEARAHLARLAQGVDVAAERRARRDVSTFGEAFAWYLDNHARPRKVSWRHDEARFHLHLSDLAPVKLSAITRAQVRELHAAIGATSGPYAANRVLALVSVVFNRAISDELFSGANPAAAVEPFREHSRARRLQPSEMRAFWQALEEEPSETFRDYVLISLFTGARKSNVLAMRWEDVSLADATWTIPRTKNGTAQVLPLGDAELAILRRRLEQSDGPWVFPGRSDAAKGHLAKPEHGWARLLARGGLRDLRIHDLRRSLGSWMVDTGASLPVVGKTLNHLDPSSTAVYARLSLAPVREAKARAIAAMRQAGSTTAPATQEVPPPKGGGGARPMFARAAFERPGERAR